MRPFYTVWAGSQKAHCSPFLPSPCQLVSMYNSYKVTKQWFTRLGAAQKGSTERPRYFLQFFSQKSSVHDKNRWMGSITLLSLKSLIILCDSLWLLPLEYFFTATPPPKKKRTRGTGLCLSPGLGLRGARPSSPRVWLALRLCCCLLLPLHGPHLTLHPRGTFPVLRTHSLLFAYTTPSPCPFTDAYCS